MAACQIPLLKQLLLVQRRPFNYQRRRLGRQSAFQNSQRLNIELGPMLPYFA
jgi:hypothetical protein